MFSGFLKFFNRPVQYDIYGSGYRTFVIAFGGMAFGKGLFSVFDRGDIRYWERIIKKAFPEYEEKFDLFGHDWLGRCFAVETSREGIEKIVIFDPGVLEMYDVPLSFMDFVNKAIPMSTNDCLALDSFVKWYQNGGCELEYQQCVGYKKPLFMGGEEGLDNLEVTKMEAYWRMPVQAVKQRMASDAEIEENDFVEYDEGSYGFGENENAEYLDIEPRNEEDEFFAQQAREAEEFFELQKKRGPYIKRNVEKYLEKFKKMHIKDSKISWNWCAFLFFEFWFAYRKMYGAAVIVWAVPYVIGAAIGLALGLTDIALESVTIIINIASVVVGLVVMLIVGMLGDHFYEKKVDKLVAKGDAAVSEDELQQVVKKGGVSGIALAIAIVLSFAFSLFLELI